jgi:hypothetical protein
MEDQKFDCSHESFDEESFGRWKKVSSPFLFLVKPSFIDVPVIIELNTDVSIFA